jgi:hypothetical protein
MGHLQKKFPEASGFLQRINDNGGATAHSIDACSLHTTSQPEVVTSGAPYDHIIFHHPHLGVEDMRKHQALLGHFLHCASQPSILKQRGVIHVTLGGRQPKDWKVIEQIERHGLAILMKTVRIFLHVTRFFL